MEVQRDLETCQEPHSCCLAEGKFEPRIGLQSLCPHHYPSLPLFWPVTPPEGTVLIASLWCSAGGASLEAGECSDCQSLKKRQEFVPTDVLSLSLSSD